MKVLVTTRETQGQRRNDFSHTHEGELAYPGTRCSAGSTDDGCGCWRSMIGAETFKGSTTLRVVERAMSREEWVEEVGASLHRSDWGSPARCRGFAREMFPGLQTLIRSVPADTVVEFRYDRIRRRAVVASN